MSSSETPACPRCGSDMLIRRAQLGPRAGTPYWSCVRGSECGGAMPADASLVVTERSA